MADSPICSIPNCGKPALNIRGYCNAHYIRWRRHGDPLGGGKTRKPIGKICIVDGCGKPQRISYGYCGTHYSRFRLHGDPLKGARKPTPICKIEGCDKISDGLGYCAGHLARLNRHGDPLYGGPLTNRASNGKPLEWLLQHVKHSEDECLLWPFGRDSYGYGSLLYDGADNRAHRVICILAHGEPPSDDHEVAHGCGRGHFGCVNPNHVRWALRIDNMRDKIAHGTTNRGEKAAASKLTGTDVRQIRALRCSKSRNEIADLFGICVASVRAIHIGRTWSWLK
ncbi:MAG: hypothetical protein JWP25_8948 [Bradyrhizobium sp.]|nr:hypothetical protein [Bradyrhizobium sp.]